MMSPWKKLQAASLWLLPPPLLQQLLLPWPHLLPQQLLLPQQHPLPQQRPLPSQAASP